jgi:hypothetical protein
LYPHLKQRLSAAAGDRAADIDWEIVERADRDRSGVPVRITFKGQRPDVALR